MENEISLGAIYKPSEDVVARDIDGEILLIPIASGIGDLEDEFYTLNETGRAIWEQIDGQSSLDQIANRLSQSYDAPLDRIRKEVLGLVAELKKRQILVVVTST